MVIEKNLININLYIINNEEMKMQTFQFDDYKF